MTLESADAIERADLTRRSPVEVVEDFVALAFSGKDIAAAFERDVAEDYIQHNPDVADGREAAKAFFYGLWQEVPGFRYDVRHVLTGEGGLVALHAFAAGKPDEDDRGAVIVDIFRVEGGLIREHWDSVQPIPPTAANDHPMF